MSVPDHCLFIYFVSDYENQSNNKNKIIICFNVSNDESVIQLRCLSIIKFCLKPCDTLFASLRL